MSKTDKLLSRFLSKPKDFTYEELKKLLTSFGYKEEKTGKTSGSRVTFYNRAIDDEIKLHRPHPSPVLRQYQLNDIEKRLKAKEVIK